MNINKDELKRALEIVKPGLATKEVIEQSTSFAFVNGSVVTYNDEISISHPIALDITGAIQADELYKFLGKVSVEEIDLTVKEEEIILKAGRAVTGFTLKSEITLPIEEDEFMEKGKWKKIPTDFIKVLKFVSMSVASDLSNAKLSCVHVNSTGFIESTDNYRITHYKFNNEFKFNSFLIPGSSVSVVTKMDPTHISEGTGWIHFKTAEGTIISCRTVNDTFPDTAPYLKLKEKQVSSIELPKSLGEILDRAIIFAKRSSVIDENVTITISGKKLLVSTQSESAWFKESVAVATVKEEINFSITPYLLKDIISKTTTCAIYEHFLKFEGGKEGEVGSWIYITSLKQTV